MVIPAVPGPEIAIPGAVHVPDQDSKTASCALKTRPSSMVLVAAIKDMALPTVATSLGRVPMHAGFAAWTVLSATNALTVRTSTTPTTPVPAPIHTTAEDASTSHRPTVNHLVPHALNTSVTVYARNVCKTHTSIKLTAIVEMAGILMA